MRNAAKTICASLLVTAALACGACATVEQAPSPAANASPAAGKPVLVSEGVETPCKVSFAAGDEAHRELFLQEGDSVAVIAPSSLPTPEQVDATVAGLKSWGYVPVLGKHVVESERTLKDCLDDLRWALEDPGTRAIFCVRGGYGASEVMDELPLELVASSRKLIIGYSDITVFHSAWTSAGVPSLQSCMSATFDGLSDSSAAAIHRVIAGDIPTYTCEASELCRGGEAEGVLIGGNLSTFVSVLGTAYDCTQTDEPYILFFEDVEENYQHVHRYLTLLKHLGVLDKAAGIVFGEWTDYTTEGSGYMGDSRGGTFSSMADMISRELLGDASIPVAYGFPAGHGDQNYPLLMGVPAQLRVCEGTFTLDWPTQKQ